MEKTIDKMMDIIPYLTSIPYRKIWVDYDKEADVIYMNFTYPPEAVEHEEYEEGIIKNYNKLGDLVGITVIAVSRFTKKSKNRKDSGFNRN